MKCVAYKGERAARTFAALGSACTIGRASVRGEALVQVGIIFGARGYIQHLFAASLHV
jgi:hypothetical protein